MKLEGLSDDKKKMLVFIVGGLIAVLVIATIAMFLNGGPEEVGGGSNYADDAAIDKEMAEYYDKYPVASFLPIIEDEFRIDYGECETSDGEFCIMISADTQIDREHALVALYNADPSSSGKYPIEYFSLNE